MPRRRNPKKRPIIKDPVFHSETITAYVNDIMRHGKKSVATKIVNNAIDLVTAHFIKENRIEEQAFQTIVNEKRELLNLSKDDQLPKDRIGLVVLYRSLDNTRPHVEVRSNRIGGDTRQVPRAITFQRSQRLARGFLKKAALARRSSTHFQPGDKGMAKLLALEWIDAYDGKGGAVKMCMDTHRMAKANQAYVYTRSSVNQSASSEKSI